MNAQVTGAYQVIDGLFKTLCGELQMLPQLQLEEALHTAEHEAKNPESAIHQVAAQFVFKCAEAVLEVRRGA